MSRIGYFEYLRQYAKLNREEPRIRSAGDMWRLMAVPLIAGVTLYVPFAMLFSHYTKCPLPDPLHLAFKTAWQTLLVIYVIPLLGLHFLIAFWIRPEVSSLKNDTFKQLRHGIILSHLPWISFWCISWIPLAALIMLFFCRNLCYEQLDYHLGIIILVVIAVVFSIITGYLATIKARSQIKEIPILRDMGRSALFCPFVTKLKTHKAQAIYHFSFALFCVAISLFIEIMLIVSGSKDTSSLSFFPMMNSWASALLIFIFYGIICIGKSTHSKQVCRKIANLDETDIKHKLTNLSDFDICVVFEHLLSQTKSLHAEMTTEEMQSRGLLGKETIQDLNDLYLFMENEALLGIGDIRITDHYILFDLVPPYSSKCVIHNDRIDSVIIHEKHFIVTVIVLEVKFHRKSYRDKIRFRTDHLDQWLALFEKLGVPVEDRRKSEKS